MTTTKKKTAKAATGSDYLLPRNRLTSKILQAKADTVWIGAPKGLGKSVLIKQLEQAITEQMLDHKVIILQLDHNSAEQDLLVALTHELNSNNLGPSRNCKPINESLIDLLKALSTKNGRAQTLHLLVDGLDIRLNGSLSHYLIQSCQALSGRIRLYLGVDDFVPLQPNSLFLDQRHLHLDMQDLRMNREELSDFFQLHARETSDKEISRLLKKTDGVPSAIALLLDNYDESIAHQCLLLTQWIEHNLLRYLDPMETLRLASLSILTEFNIEQASGMIGVPHAETCNWLTHYTPLCFSQSEDDGQFAWSQLMQPFFFNLLIERYRDLLPNILRQAEPWLIDSNVNERCLDYIINSIEKPWASNVLLTRCKTWYGQRDATSVTHLIERIPPMICLAHDELTLYYCWALIVHKRIGEALVWLQDLELRTHSSPFNAGSNATFENIAVLKALISFYDQPRPSYSVQVGLLENCLSRQSLFQGEVLSLYANTLHAVGASDLSMNALKQAIRFHESNDNLPHVSHAKMLFWQCEYNQGNTESALKEARTYISQLQIKKQNCSTPDEHRAFSLSIAMIKTGLAGFLYEFNQLMEAKVLYEEAIPELTNSDWTYVRVIAQVGLTRLYISEGSYEQSLQEIDNIKRRAPHRENSSLNAILCFESMRILRAQGKSVLPAASEYGMDVEHLSVEALFMDQYGKERLYWIKCYALMLIEQKNYTSALIYSVKGLIKSLGANDHRCRVLFSNIKALCEFKLGQNTEAYGSMNISMQLVQKYKFIRTLLNDDFGWSDLWHHMDSHQEFTTDLVPSFLSEMRVFMAAKMQHQEATPSLQGKQDAMALLENSRKLGLTDKELEILNLLAEGLCNKKIASRSEIALTTVKWHLQNIFGKLQARNRTEAVVKAQEYAIIGKIQMQ